jgi:hypothetical protein
MIRIISLVPNLSPKFLDSKGIMRFAATGDMSELPDQVEMPSIDWVIPEFAKKTENK